MSLKRGHWSRGSNAVGKQTELRWAKCNTKRSPEGTVYFKGVDQIQGSCNRRHANISSLRDQMLPVSHKVNANQKNKPHGVCVEFVGENMGVMASLIQSLLGRWVGAVLTGFTGTVSHKCAYRKSYDIQSFTEKVTFYSPDGQTSDKIFW